MAQRVAGKAKKQARKAAPAEPAKSGAGSKAARGRVAELEAECSRLKAEVEAQRARLAELEDQRRHLVDRIDWAIDTLHGLLDE